MKDFFKRKEADINRNTDTSQDVALNPLDHVKTSDSTESVTETREQWSHKLDFFIACVGYAVSAGNIYRFPYLCFRNGGGAFLIPYFLALFTCGMPLFFLELALGQFSGLGALHVWEICPLFKGLGYGMVVVSSIVTSYYNIVMTWILYYLVKSCTKTLPWSGCNNEWNTEMCRSMGELNTSQIHYGNISVSDYNLTATSFQVNSSEVISTDIQSSFNESLSWNSPATEYWRYKVLKISSRIEEIESIHWELFGYYVLGWGITFVCLCKGIKSMGKVAYVTATLPYLFLTILLVRGVLLPGAMDGIKYFIIPDWNKLLNLKVWTEACLQIFYSLGPAWGGLITMASHNKFHNNCLKDAILIPIINCLTSFYGGFVIFSVAGYMAYITGKTVEEVGASGLGLTFIAYPEAIATMPLSPLWAILFFLMMLSLTIDTQFGLFETMVGSCIDTFPKYLRKRKILFTAGVCVAEVILGFILCSRAGYYIFTLFDWYVGAFSLLLISCIECLIVYWIYGIDRFYYDINLMLGYKPSVWWKICWGFISPGILLFVWVYNLANYAQPYYLDYIYTTPWVALGWVIATISIAPMIYLIIKAICMQSGSFKERLLKCLKPGILWGPSDKTIDYKPEQALMQYQGILPFCQNQKKTNAATQDEKTSFCS